MSVAAAVLPITHPANTFTRAGFVWRIAFPAVAESPHRLRNVGNGLPPPASGQCTLTVSSSWLQALAIAASRLSVSMIGVPSAACRA